VINEKKTQGTAVGKKIKKKVKLVREKWLGERAGKGFMNRTSRPGQPFKVRLKLYIKYMGSVGTRTPAACKHRSRRESASISFENPRSLSDHPDNTVTSSIVLRTKPLSRQSTPSEGVHD
jgi:hypothetical protein